MKYLSNFIIISIFHLFSFEAFSQIILLNEMPRPLYYERLPRIKKAKDWKCVGDIVHSDKYWMRHDIFSGHISYNIARIMLNNEDAYSEVRHAMGFHFRTRVIEEFYISTTFFKDFNPNARAPWIADFTYSFGRYNWRPKTWSYGYENYAPNKYSDTGEEILYKFLQGNFFFSYNHGLFDRLLEKLRIDNTGLVITPFFRYSFRFIDAEQNISRGLGRPNMGISARYTFWNRFYVESAIYGYVSPQHKQPWDPDYTYGFGYFDWRPFRLSLTYGNWVVNRFPWNEKYFEHYGFLDGNFRINFNYAW
jgi:hypothetical protein